MINQLSILTSDFKNDLSVNRREDVIAIVLKGVVGATPVVGSLLGETLTQFIPNQKLERIADCLTIFADKVKYLEADLLAAKIRTEEFADLFEDIIASASRALTSERKEYLAALLKNSLTRTDLDHLGHKKILALLNELNDAEIIIAKYHTFVDQNEKWEFQQRHNSVITGYKIPPDATQEERDRHLMFMQNHETIDRLKLNVTNSNGYHLGKLLLRYIDLEQ